jgi:hypothetical protein
MGTREVYEEKLRNGAHLHRDPTINPGLGSPRCPRCLSPLNPTAVRLFPFPASNEVICSLILTASCSCLVVGRRREKVTGLLPPYYRTPPPW